MDSTATAFRLEDGLRRGRPVNVQLRNLVASRSVLLGDLLGVAHSEKIRLLPGVDWNYPLWLIVAGSEQRVLAQVGISSELLRALGVAPQLPLPVLSAAAEQMLSPLLPSLRDLFEQDVTVRVENEEGACPDTEGWSKFMLRSYSLKMDVGCRIHDAYSQKLVDRACAIPPIVHYETRLSLLLGVQKLLTAPQLRELQVGDVIVVTHAEPHLLELRIDSSTSLLTNPRLAVVNRDDGRVVHLSPGSWPAIQPGAAGADGAAVAVDIVVARTTLTAQQCRKLALAECVAEWGRVAWLDQAELRACGRILGTVRAMTVAGCQGYEVMRLSLGSLDR
jgi:hypothetical protein